MTLVHPEDIFDILGEYVYSLVDCYYGDIREVPSKMGERITNFPVNIIMEELGPKFWDKNMDMCVDYAHTI